jgi:hypothetical protein
MRSSAEPRVYLVAILILLAAMFVAGYGAGYTVGREHGQQAKWLRYTPREQAGWLVRR